MEAIIEKIEQSRNRQLVPDEKFDEHMAKARLADIESRKAIFCATTDDGEQRRVNNKTIHSSVY